MKGLRFIRNRIKSVKNTQRITRAMKMVAAAKFSKVEGILKNFRVYSENLIEDIEELLKVIPQIEHPFITKREEKKIDLIIITSDRGLCGSYNSNIIKLVEKRLGQFREMNIEVNLGSIGRKGSEYFKKRGFNLISEFNGEIQDNMEDIMRGIFEQKVKTRFLNNEVDAIYVVHSSFVSAITQTPVIEKLLPFDIDVGSVYSVIPIIEPDGKIFVEKSLQEYFDVKVRKILIESAVSEHSARMTAMENATKNADDMINELTLTFNKARQASITAELLDITNGKEAIEFG